MRTIAARSLASVLSALLAASCGTARESRQADIEERVFLPSAPRAVASPVVDELELRGAIEELLAHVNVEETRAELRRMVADPRFHGRRPGELRVVLASWGSGPVALEEIGREYRTWCAAVHRTNCIEGPLTDSSIYNIAFDFAMGSQWDGFVREVKSTIDPSTIQIILLTGLVVFMATIAIPELVSKIPAAAATMVLTAYLGARAVCDLVFGWIQMVRELDAATTFNEVRAAGQRYGHLVGAQTARILILLATAAIAQGGLIARLMKLPRAAQASAALAAETGGVALEAVGTVKGVRVLQGGVALTVGGVANGAVGVAMASHDALQQTGQPRPEPSSQTPQRGSRVIESKGTGTPPAKVTGGGPKINMGRQGKHIPGHNNFEPGRSILRADPESLASRAGTGAQVGRVPVGQPGSKERVVFDDFIGDYVDEAGVATPTKIGIIHYSSDGIHIVPGRPQ
jgi:hypothetical protein